MNERLVFFIIIGALSLLVGLLFMYAWSATKLVQKKNREIAHLKAKYKEEKKFPKVRIIK